MRPVGEAVKLVHALRPVGIRLAFVLCRRVPPSSSTGVAYYAHHVSVACFYLGIVEVVGHDERGEDAVFLCSFTDVCHGTCIALSAIASSHYTDAAVFAVFVP